MGFVVNELMRTGQYILLLQVLFQQQLFVSRRAAWILTIIYILGFSILLSCGKETNLYLLGAAIQIAMSMLFLRDRWYGKALSILTLLAVPSIIVLCLNELNRCAFNEHSGAWFWDKDQGVTGNVEFFLIVLAFTLLKRRGKIIVFISNKSKSFLSAISILFLMILDWSMSEKSGINDGTLLLLTLSNMLLVCICIWVVVIESSWKQNQLQAERYMGYVRRLEAEHAAVRSMYHDMRHHLRALNGCVQADDIGALKQYLFDLGAEISSSTRNSYTHYTENPLFNALLSEKQEEAESMGVKIEFHGGLDRDIFVRMYDLCVIVSNLLDNALENIEKSESDVIEVYVSQEKDCILFQFVNRVSGDAKVRIGRTTKENNLLHGYGLRNVKKAAERYYGLFDIYIKDGKCISKVMLMRM